MSLIKWSPFLSDNYFDDFDKVVSDFSPLLRTTNSFMPAIDLYEDRDNIIVETQLSGIDPAKVDISIENDVLCIKGESEKKTEVDEKNYYRKEIRRGSFYRSIPLPSRIQEDKTTAVVDGGILKISMPKAGENKAKSIKIKAV